ncbi:DUF4190 domain-containing protein [Nocardiopsis coralliicola]
MTDESPQPRADGQQEPTVEKGGLWAVFFSAAGLLWPPFGVVFSAVGIVQGRKARKAAKASRGQAPGAVLSMVLGWAGVVLSTLAIAGYALFWNEYTTYAECSQRALTVVGQDECDAELRGALSERTGVPENQIPIGS